MEIHVFFLASIGFLTLDATGLPGGASRFFLASIGFVTLDATGLPGGVSRFEVAGILTAFKA